jgi:hypothetical protein
LGCAALRRALTQAREIPALFGEITYAVVNFLTRAFLANDLQDHVLRFADLNNRIAQRFEINHARADRVVAPRLQTRVGDVDVGVGFGGDRLF